MALFDWISLLFSKSKIQPEPHKSTQAFSDKKGGYLGYYGLRDWYDSQTKEIQDFLYKSCGYGINTDSQHLLEGDIYIVNDPEAEYPWTATKFLCNHAMTAFRERLPVPFDALMEEARNRISSGKDRNYYIDIHGHTAAGITPKPLNSEIEALKIAMVEIIQKEPGYIQSALRKAFPGENKEAVGLAISRLNHEGLVYREKKGNSFKLFLKADYHS